MELDEVKEILKKFVLRVSSNSSDRTPEEIEILPEMIKLLFEAYFS